MTVKTAFKYIALGLLVLFTAGIIYVIQAGFAIVKVSTQDTRIWLPVPIALGQLVGKMVALPLKAGRAVSRILEIPGRDWADSAPTSGPTRC